MELKTVELKKLTASDGMYLTQVNEVENRVFAKSIYLGKGESVENWREATAEEKEAYEAAEKAKMDAELAKLRSNEGMD